MNKKEQKKLMWLVAGITLIIILNGIIKKEAFWFPAIGAGGIHLFNLVNVSSLGLGLLFSSWALILLPLALLLGSIFLRTNPEVVSSTGGIEGIWIYIVGFVLVIMILKAFKKR